MNLSSFIARRYFKSKKQSSFINIISYISILLIAVCTASLIVVLSIFNGLEGLLKEQFNVFDPPLKVLPVKGKSFDLLPEKLSEIKALEGIEVVTSVIEDYAYVKYRDRDMVVTIKGVSDEFLQTNLLDTAIISGEKKLFHNHVPYAIVGNGVKYSLAIMPGNDLFALQVHYIKDIKPGRMTTSQLYSKKNILPGAVFAIEKNIDEQYIIVPLSFIQELFNYGNKLTALDITVVPEYNVLGLKNELKAILGPDFKVLTDAEQHESIYKLIKLEKFFVFLVFSLIMGVSSVNIFFSLSMLAIEKKKDISILYALGATNRTIKNIFLKEGIMIALAGAIIGLLLGLGFYYIQTHFGILSFGIESTVVSAYPVKLKIQDLLLTGSSIIVITFLSSIRPAIIAQRYNRISDY